MKTFIFTYGSFAVVVSEEIQEVAKAIADQIAKKESNHGLSTIIELPKGGTFKTFMAYHRGTVNEFTALG